LRAFSVPGAFARDRSDLAGGKLSHSVGAGGQAQQLGRRLAVRVAEVSGDLGEALVEQPGEPSLGVGEFRYDEASLTAQHLKALAVLRGGLPRLIAAVADSLGDRDSVVLVGLAAAQMPPALRAGEHGIDQLDRPALGGEEAVEVAPVVAARALNGVASSC